MELAGAELPLCFTPEDAKAFHEALARQCRTALERLVSRKPELNSIDKVNCGDADSEKAHQMTQQKSTFVKRLGRTGRTATDSFFAYRLKVSAERRNYVTFALDGTEVGAIP